MAACEILLAEDNDADVTLVQRALALQEIDCNLHIVRDGRQAIAFLEQLERDRYPRYLDLLLLDIRLPKHDGKEVLKRLRATERLGLTPVVVITGSDSPSLEASVTKLAALQVFRKPLDPAEFMRLGEIVRDILTARGRYYPRERSIA